MYDYLASPYTHHDSVIRHKRYEQARHALYLLLSRRIPAYSPIVHCHHLSLNHDMPHDAEFWQWYDFNMIDPCRRLIVLQLPGWKESVGVTAELQYAEKIGTPTVGLTVVEGDQLVFEKIAQELAEGVHPTHKA